MSEATILGTAPAFPRPFRSSAWWTVPIAVERGAALRIAVGATLLFDLLVTYLPNLSALYGPDGIGPASRFDGIFAPPSATWSLLRILPESWGPGAVLAMAVLGTTALLVGYRPRLAAFVAWVCMVSFFHAGPSIHNGGDRLKIFALMLLCFIPSDGCWAIRRHPLARASTGPVLVQPWPFRLVMLQLAVMYFMNGYYKMLGPKWRDGTVMHDVANNPAWAHFPESAIPLPPIALQVLTWATLVWELGFPFFVALKGLRNATLWIGVIFHVLTFVHLEIGLFPIYAICLYVPFVPWERYRRSTPVSTASPPAVGGPRTNT